MTGKEVEIKPAKGRPMLTWVGKRPLRHVTAFPAQLVEKFDPTPTLPVLPLEGPASGEGKGGVWQDWPAAYPKGGLLFHGDNKEVLAHLLANGFRGKVKLIYIDPPFDSGADYVRQVALRGISGTAKLDGERYTLGEQIQYTDIWANDNYLQFMYERLLLLKEVLADDGSIYLHCDRRKSHHLRALMDEVFAMEHFENEIVWKRTTARGGSDYYNHIHDNILFYTKGEGAIWNQQHTPYSGEYLETMFRHVDSDGRRWRESPLSAPGTSSGASGRTWKGINPASIGLGRHWAIPGYIRPCLSDKAQGDTVQALDELDAIGRIVWSKEGVPNFKQYEDDLPGVELQSIWLDIAGSETDYPTEKPKPLLERIILSSSSPGDIVLDCFIGSGTTAAVAQKLGRRWIGCDINKGAIQTTSKRLQTIILEQVEAAEKRGAQSPLPLTGEGPGEGQLPSPPGRGAGGEGHPAQLSFAAYRVNDYDLQIQHNEAVNLACEHIGITRTRTDPYFDGTLGQRLAKIVPFTHPLTLLDLEELKKELAARPDEQRDIVVVCLGKETAADAWLEEWNLLRYPTRSLPAGGEGWGGVPNKIEVIELRTDPKYGKLFVHQPARARVDIRRVGALREAPVQGAVREPPLLIIEIKDFLSPTIVERLQQQAGLLKPQIEDWRAMVDCVMVDTAYNGEVFHIALSDVPAKKTDLVAGQYEFPAPEGETTVAVKIVDMLGEEVLVAQRV